MLTAGGWPAAQALSCHADLVTCVAADGDFAVSGSADTALCVYAVSGAPPPLPPSPDPCQRGSGA